MKPRTLARIAATTGALFATTAQAQPVIGTRVGVEATTDWRERGLSWSDGKPAAGAFARVPLTSAFALDVDAITLRESARHGGADAGVIVAPRYTLTTGGWGFSAGARGNIFVGRSGMSYGEIVAEAERTIGPVQLSAGAEFAPSQNAIGGHNLHLGAQASVGLPLTPLTVYGGIGHTSGSSRDDPRAWRLRPGGSYTDHRIGIEHASPFVSVGLRYSGTSISADEVDRSNPFTDRHYGSRVVAYVRLST